MSNIVENNVKSSGGFIAPEPTTPVRTLAYHLRGGGFISLPCPKWCTSSHEDDLDGTLHPVDLCHEGDEISLSFTTNEGERDTILAARITQFPFSTGSDGSELPHMALMPVAGNGETLGYQTPTEVYAEIRRVREYLLKLEQLNGQLVAEFADPLPAWMSLNADQINTMPMAELLAAFEAVVVEVDKVPRGGLSILHEEDEQLEVWVLRSLTQKQREAAIRNAFLKFTGQNR